ncbi:MAG: glycosyl hydrolase [Bacteroidales bacterium]
MKIFYALTAFLFLVLTSGCDQPQMVDKYATPETKALFQNLRDQEKGKILFGHQDDLAYGIRWANEPFRSDVADVCGKYPALFGWDLSKLENDSPVNIDTVPFDRMQKWIIRAFEKGGVNTISWHMDNLVSGGDAWNTTTCVKSILPGGEKHEQFKTRLDKAAAFFLSLKDSQGRMVPVIFRPWHENDGSWFWWGVQHCTTEEYIALWRFTVSYLRDSSAVHNLLYAYSWGDFSDEASYRTRYPGDEWVDVLGVDIYGNIDTEAAIRRLGVLVQMAVKTGKIAALTEAGEEGIKSPEWFTKHFLLPIKQDKDARGIAYFMVWRNGTDKHFYAPYPGHASCGDFIEFEKDSTTRFLEDLGDLYSTR